ncbi:hypothetical protein ACH4TE_00905 [Streptomyces sioyaensis]|uniref:hypothetical protein n=1 Tax=Streptomyces sioyaensis TaxID=67364 RepID=UPI00379F9F79
MGVAPHSRHEHATAAAPLPRFVRVEGSAVCFASALTQAFPDALYLSCAGDLIRLDLPEADFRIRVFSSAASTVGRFDFQAVFRAPEEAGGTWWTSWTVGVDHGPGHLSRCVELLVDETRDSRRRFARMLADARPTWEGAS